MMVNENFQKFKLFKNSSFYLIEQMAEMFDNVETNPVRVFYKMVNTTSYLTKHTILDDQVQSLLKSNIKFDLVISEVAMNEALFGKN